MHPIRYRWYTVTATAPDGRVVSFRDVRAVNAKHAIARAEMKVPEGGAVKASRSDGSGLSSLLRL